MTVHIPTALRSYTNGKSEVDAEGRTLAEALSELDREYPGIRFRIVTEQDTVRPHIRIFVNGEQARNLTAPLQREDRICIVCALSGG